MESQNIPSFSLWSIMAVIRTLNLGLGHPREAFMFPDVCVSFLRKFSLHTLIIPVTFLCMFSHRS